MGDNRGLQGIHTLKTHSPLQAIYLNYISCLTKANEISRQGVNASQIIHICLTDKFKEVKILL